MQMTSSSSSKPKKIGFLHTPSPTNVRRKKRLQLRALKLTNVHSIVSFISIRYFTTVDPRPFEEVNCISDKSLVRNHTPYWHPSTPNPPRRRQFGLDGHDRPHVAFE